MRHSSCSQVALSDRPSSTSSAGDREQAGRDRDHQGKEGDQEGHDERGIPAPNMTTSSGAIAIFGIDCVSTRSG